MAGLQQSWIDARLNGGPATLTPEQIEPAKSCLLYVPDLATFCVDEEIAGPLPELIEHYADSEKSSKSRYVREELEFARGCLLLVRGRAAEARKVLEPLARTSISIRRHRVLGRDYEALRLWRPAAEEYEQVLRNPSVKWLLSVPAVWSLDQFRLARIYQTVGDADRARRWYARFLADWKDADPGIPEVGEARRRLQALGGPANPAN